VKYSDEKLQEMALVVLSDYAERGELALRLIVTIAVAIGMEPDRVLEKITELANG